MSGPIRYNQDKFRELILHIGTRMRGQKFFGAVKLNKALFMSDFYSFAVMGQPITGSPYRHLPMGPCPTYLVPVREEMVRNGEIEIIEDDVFGKKQNRIIPHRKPNLALFSPEEISFVDNVLDSILEMNGKELSDITHEFMGWILTEIGEDIPYHSIFIGNRPATKFDEEQAREVFALTA